MEIEKVEKIQDLDSLGGQDALVVFLHEHLKPYEDNPQNIRRGIEYALSVAADRGGFVLLAHEAGGLHGALVMLHTPMGGYIPANILLFVAVRSDQRGRGIGGRLVETAVKLCSGPVKLHVEYDNPAKALYERIGFGSKYAEMRHPGPGGGDL